MEHSVTHRRLVTLGLFIILLFAAVNPATASPEDVQSHQNDEKIQLIWVANTGQGEQVFFSEYYGKTWSEPVQLSKAEGFVFRPATATDGHGSRWAVWPQRAGSDVVLVFTVNTGHGWMEPQPFDTHMPDNRAVCMIADEQATVWLAWTASNGACSDVYWSHNDGAGWSTPERVHPANNVPDRSPSLSLDNQGRVLISWKSYAHGRYVECSRIRQQGKWLEPPTSVLQWVHRKQTTVLKNLPPLPTEVQLHEKATLFVRGPGEVVSIPASRLPGVRRW